MAENDSILALDATESPTPHHPQAGLEAATKAGVTLLDNVGRHTFISMHVERYENVVKTAKEANNSPEVIEEHYRHLVSPADVVQVLGN
jgi:hypothetical protein